MIILRKQAHKRVGCEGYGPTAITLMLQALDFADQLKIVEVGQRRRSVQCG